MSASGQGNSIALFVLVSDSENSIHHKGPPANQSVIKVETCEISQAERPGREQRDDKAIAIGDGAGTVGIRLLCRRH